MVICFCVFVSTTQLFILAASGGYIMYDMIFVDFLISIMNNKHLICIDLTYITTTINTWLKIDLRRYYNCNIGLVNLLQRSGLLQSLLKRKRGWEKRVGNVHNHPSKKSPNVRSKKKRL